MKRRNFLTGAAGAGAAVLATRAHAQDHIEWKMATAWPRGLPGLGTGAARLAERIGKMSNGRLTIKLFAAGELVKEKQCFEAVSQGMAEMGHDAAYYHLDKSPACGFFAAVPFGLTANELNAWVYFGGGQELWDDLYGAFNLKGFLAGNTGVQMGGWFRKEIQSLADLKGLKFRMPGQGGQALARLGVEVTDMPADEIYTSLQSGALDGAEWVGPYNDLSLGYYKIAKYYYWPGFHEPGTALQLIINKQKFDALPDDLKQIIAAAAATENDIMYAEFIGRSAGALNTLITEHDVQLKQFPKDVLVAFGAAAGKVMQEVYDTGDDITKRVAGSYFGFRRDVKNWTRISELGYETARMLKFKYPSETDTY
ncbi:MAG TPA: TRAP transporter substrate-binding protein [Dongiaceae bacterium]|jgi:TRAP-type mannitol/chloroaromatic compound transport system substrate-binding protein|nr:TRAP transporter substrate-binding protein [Dongiaceae bacterium]